MDISTLATLNILNMIPPNLNLAFAMLKNSKRLELSHAETVFITGNNPFSTEVLVLSDLFFMTNKFQMNEYQSKSKSQFLPTRLSVPMAVYLFVRHNFFFRLNRLGITP